LMRDESRGDRIGSLEEAGFLIRDESRGGRIGSLEEPGF
jgi:hypothetical protein